MRECQAQQVPFELQVAFSFGEDGEGTRRVFEFDKRTDFVAGEGKRSRRAVSLSLSAISSFAISSMRLSRCSI